MIYSSLAATLLFISGIVSHLSATDLTKRGLPFSNLSFPVDSVTECLTYNQPFIQPGNTGFLLNPTKSISFFTQVPRAVKTVAESHVVAVRKIGSQWLVITECKGYYFTYSDLSQVSVLKGDILCENDVIGITGYDIVKRSFVVGFSMDSFDEELDPMPFFKY